MKFFEKYLEYYIAYSESLDRWTAFEDEDLQVSVAYSSDLTKLKTTLAKRNARKEKKKFKRIPVVFIEHDSSKYEVELVKGEVTSIREDNRAWVTKKDKEKSRVLLYSFHSAYLDTPENEVYLTEYKEISEKIKELELRRDEVKKNLEKFDVNKIKNEDN